MSHFVAYILQFQEIIVYKIPPGGGGGSIASLRSNYLDNPQFFRSCVVLPCIRRPLLPYI